MRSVRGKPFKKSAWQLNILTVLVCPVNLPTPSTFLRVLNATQQQVTDSANGLTEGMSRVLFDTEDGSTANVLSEPAEHLTTQQISGRDSTAADWIAYGGEAIFVTIIVLILGYKLYQLCARQARADQETSHSIEPGLPLQDAMLCSPSLGFYSGGRLRPMPLLHSSAMPRPSAPPAARDPPPPYEAPPPYDSNWRI
eukprot:Blabericola_migrator_1__3359@NODE_1993_length_3449_cov_51_658782_g1269_i0_p3_GENE_NODE_1993_length_3449_cov_51_658782_g1269_i0NODE_1993_length_3449_cov_51_658782_g1269_i0_p3_ORF_typecomplete_len197_score21_78SARAF/PF06682_12/0_1_NODE_1993_length_3449_cov_51_658782_g1269_i010600